MRAQQPYRPRHEGYVSEFESFFDGYLHEHPALPRDQEHGWYLLWDKHVDFDELTRDQASTVPLKPRSYSYR
jgi:hypothetical protein